jgi:hypothetical protein
MKSILSIIVFIEVFLVICFPTAGISASSAAFYTYFMYLLIPITYCISHNKNLLQNDILGKSYLRVIVKYIILTCLGAVFSYIFSKNTVNDAHTIFSVFMYGFFAYVFYILPKDKKISRSIKISILISAFILGVYSIYSYVTVSNIYTDYLSHFLRSSDFDSTTQDYSDARGIRFRVSGNVNNPVFFSGELMMLLAFCCYEYLRNDKKTYKSFLIICILILLIGTFVTGSKSGILPSLFLVFYTLYKAAGIKKTVIYSFVFVLLSTIVLPIISSILKIDFSILFNSLNVFSDHAGSTVGMRTSQLSGLLDCVGNNLFFGNGIGWCHYYNMKYGSHQILLGFESILFSSFCEGGIWGLFVVLPIFLVGYYKLKIDSSKFSFYKIFLYSYYFFLIATGLGAIKFFFIWMGIMLRDYEKDLKINVSAHYNGYCGKWIKEKKLKVFRSKY